MMSRPGFRMLPEITSINEDFWTGGAQGELRIYRCGGCGRFFHPPSRICHRCRSRDVGPEAVSGYARVAACTVNYHQWFPEFDPPYSVAIVELSDEPDVRLTTNVVGCDPEQVEVGMPVCVEFEDWDPVWIPVFRPVEAA